LILGSNLGEVGLGRGLRGEEEGCDVGEKSKLVLAAPGPLLTPPPSSPPQRPLPGPTPPKFDPHERHRAFVETGCVGFC
jgi:hypothetical protein